MIVSTMKSAVIKFLVSVTDPCLGWFSPLSVLFSLAALTVVFFGLALVCMTLIGPVGWWRRHRLARSPG
jgi:hypothetical protein